MNYTEHSKEKKPKFSNYFYIIIAICIIVLGVAAWFALSNISGNDEQKEYPNDNSSSIESVPDVSMPEISVPEISIPTTPQTPTNQSETEVPFDAPPVDADKTDAVSFKMAVDGEIVKDFSDSALLFSKTYGDMRLHLGTDIACLLGTSVSAIADGTVQSVEKDGDLGNVVIITHGDCTVKYASLEEIKVKNGDTVEMGDILGITGTVISECEDAPHLHLEAYKNNSPVSILKAFGIE